MMSSSRRRAISGSDMGGGIPHPRSGIPGAFLAGLLSPRLGCRVTCRGRFLRARSVFVACAAVALAVGAPASAEEVPAPPLPTADRMAASVAVPRMQATNRALLMPPERTADLQAHGAARRASSRTRARRPPNDREQCARSLAWVLAM